MNNHLLATLLKTIVIQYVHLLDVVFTLYTSTTNPVIRANLKPYLIDQIELTEWLMIALGVFGKRIPDSQTPRPSLHERLARRVDDLGKLPPDEFLEVIEKRLERGTRRKSIYMRK